MDILEKARILGEAGRYDSCGPKVCEVKVREGLGGVYTAKAEHKHCRLFKTLMDNRCSHDCGYCGNSVSCTKKSAHASYEPEELARVFSYMREKLSIHGLFLSSAVCGDPDRTTERMLEAVKIIRNRQGFRGYVHFKVLPGTSRDLIAQAAELSDRMSINIEAPNGTVMSEMSATKDYASDIVKRQSWMSGLLLPSGQTTQVIVNGLATDREVLRMASWEYESMKLRRVYYSAFRPVPGTPMEGESAESSLRQHRLYNADFLVRDYGYSLKELFSIMDGGMLPRADPKEELFNMNYGGPVDVNEAPYEDLIRVPGIGPKSARVIVKKRSTLPIRKWGDLKMLGIHVKKARPHVRIGGSSQSRLADFCG